MTVGSDAEWLPIEEIPPEFLDGRSVFVKREYEGRTVFEGYAAFRDLCFPEADLSGPGDPLIVPPEVVTGWGYPIGIKERDYRVPTPTHFSRSASHYKESEMQRTIDLDLKPCPFCGSKDVELRAGINTVAFNNAYQVACNNCGCRTGLSVHDAETAKAWNTRVDTIGTDCGK